MMLVCSVWDSEHLCACEWIDEGRTMDPACPGNSTHGAQAKVQATIDALGENDVSGAGGHADTQAEEVMSRDLPYPKSGHWDKQVRCDICKDGKSACQGGWTSGILGFMCGLAVFTMFCCCMSYVSYIVPNERKDLVTKILIVHTCCNLFTAITVGYILMPMNGEPVFMPPRGPCGIMIFIMGTPLWLGWIVSTKVWEDADGGDDEEKQEKDSSG
jgi:hypothetical protein